MKNLRKTFVRSMREGGHRMYAEAVKKFMNYDAAKTDAEFKKSWGYTREQVRELIQ